MEEQTPLASIHRKVLEFLRNRTDVAVFGAQAVNAYVETSRMTQDVDVMATSGTELSELLRQHLHEEFNIAVRVRAVAGGLGFRIYQVRSSGNRHLVDVRQVPTLPPCQSVGDVLVVAPPDLIALKVISMTARPSTPKGLTDKADLYRLLIAFPEMKSAKGEVLKALDRLEASGPVHAVWQQLVDREIKRDDDDAY